MHELMHLVAAKIYGFEIFSFKPWIHKAEDGEYYFGRVVYEGENKTLICIMPFLLDTLVFISCGISMFLVENSYTSTIVHTLFATSLVDLGAAIQCRFRVHGGDLEFPHWFVATTFYWVFMLAFTLFIWSVAQH